MKATYLAAILFCALITPLPAVADSENYYELAVKAFAEGKENDAFIQVKNALQENSKHLPSRILLSELYFNAGNIPAAEHELYNALELGADINLVIPLLGTTLILQKKVDELLKFERRYNEFSPRTRFEWALLRGQTYLLENKPELAQAEFEKASEMYSDARAFNSLAAVYTRIGNVEEAEKLINKSLDIEPANAKTWQLRGELELRKGNHEKAIEYFDTAYQHDPKDPKILRSLAGTHLKLGNMEEVRTYLKLINEQTPNDPTATLIGAWLMLADNDLDAANETLAKLSDQLSLLDSSQMDKHANLIFIQGVAEYIRGNLEKAKAILLSYLERAPEDLGATQLLVDLYLKTGQSRRAIDYLETHRALVSKNLHLSLKLVQLYINDGKLINAEIFLGKLKQQYGNLPVTILMEANIEKQRKRYVEALALLDNGDFGTKPPLGYHLLRGELLIQLERLADARIIADNLLQQEPDNLDVLNFVIALNIRTQKASEALSQIDHVLAKDPENIIARFNRAIALKSLDRVDEAIDSLKGLLAKTPNHTPSLLLLARTEEQRGNSADALSWISKIQVYDPENIAAEEFKLSVYLKSQDWNAALTTVNNLLKRDRINADYLVQRSQIYTHLRKYKDAQRDLNILYGIWSEDPQKLFGLAGYQRAADDLAGARKSLEKANSLNDNLLPVKLELVRLSLSEGNIQAANEEAARLENKYGKSASISLLKGDIANSEKNYTEAQNLYLQTLKLEPNSATALINLYQLTLQGIGEKQFTKLIEDRIKQDTLPDWVIRLLADSYLNQQLFDKAKPHYEFLITRPGFDRDVGVYNNLANIYSRENLDKALTLAEKGLNLERNNAAMLDTMGWLLAQKERYPEALSHLREAFSMNATSAETRYHLGYVLAKQDRKAEAISELKAALNNGEEFSGRDEAENLLKSLQ